ncbi:MAG TPA: AAA family ATPase, partial [Candidatus Angelobacter sp.]|nr:AAA family ATPase [Candidatus Angelobacter sp.]
MLTRIYIDNFRSFVNFECRPERKQLLLGANGTGKSSLLDAIRYLKQFVEGDGNPFTRSTRTRWQDRPLQVLEVEALLDGNKFEYRVEIQHGPEPMLVNLESLKVSGTPVFELANDEIRFFPNNSRQATVLPLRTKESSLHLSQLSNSHVHRFVEWIESVHCFRIDPYLGTSDQGTSKEEKKPDDNLGNLAGWYRYLLQAHPEENLGFLNSMKESLSGFRSLRFSESRGRLQAQFLAPTRDGVTYSIQALSEGQRCLLALYMILHFLIVKGHTVFIDEPDNFIALREIQPWLMAAEEAVEDHEGQLILISHHPEILNQWAQSYGLRFFREENGHVR